MHWWQYDSAVCDIDHDAQQRSAPLRSVRLTSVGRTLVLDGVLGDRQLAQDRTSRLRARWHQRFPIWVKITHLLALGISFTHLPELVNFFNPFLGVWQIGNPNSETTNKG